MHNNRCLNLTLLVFASASFVMANIESLDLMPDDSRHARAPETHHLHLDHTAEEYFVPPPRIDASVTASGFALSNYGLPGWPDRQA